MKWQLTFDGDTWDYRTVRLVELADAEKACRCLYSDLDPVRSSGHLVALLVAHLHHVKGLSLPEALDRVKAITGAELAGIASEVTDGD